MKRFARGLLGLSRWKLAVLAAAVVAAASATAFGAYTAWNQAQAEADTQGQGGGSGEGEYGTLYIDVGPLSGNTADGYGTIDTCIGDLTVGIPFDIDIIIDGGNDLAGAYWILYYNKDVLKVTAYNWANWKIGGGGLSFTDALPDTDGALSCAYAQMAQTSGVNGAGVLQRVTLEPIANGSSDLELCRAAGECPDAADSGGVDHWYPEVLVDDPAGEVRAVVGGACPPGGEGAGAESPTPVSSPTPALTPEPSRQPTAAPTTPQLTPQRGVCPTPVYMTPADFAEPPRVVPASELPGQRVEGGVAYSEAYVTVHLPAGREFIVASAWSQDESNLAISIYDAQGESQLIVRGDGCEISRFVRQPAADAAFDEIIRTLEVGPTYVCPVPVRSTYEDLPVPVEPPPADGSGLPGERVQGGAPFKFGQTGLQLPAGREFLVGPGVSDPGGPFLCIYDIQTRSSLFLRFDGCETSRMIWDPAADAVFDGIVGALQVPAQ